jgi:hypothetical protein
MAIRSVANADALAPVAKRSARDAPRLFPF